MKVFFAIVALLAFIRAPAVARADLGVGVAENEKSSEHRGGGEGAEMIQNQSTNLPIEQHEKQIVTATDVTTTKVTPKRELLMPPVKPILFPPEPFTAPFPNPSASIPTSMTPFTSSSSPPIPKPIAPTSLFPTPSPSASPSSSPSASPSAAPSVAPSAAPTPNPSCSLAINLTQCNVTFWNESNFCVHLGLHPVSPLGVQAEIIAEYEFYNTGDKALTLTAAVGVSGTSLLTNPGYELSAHAGVRFTEIFPRALYPASTLSIFAYGEAKAKGSIADCPPVTESWVFAGGIGYSFGPTSVPTNLPTPVPTIALPTTSVPNKPIVTTQPTTRPPAPILITPTSSPTTGNFPKKPTSSPTAAAKPTTPPQATSSLPSSSPSTRKPTDQPVPAPILAASAKPTQPPPSTALPNNTGRPTSPPTSSPTASPTLNPSCSLAVNLVCNFTLLNWTDDCINLSLYPVPERTALELDVTYTFHNTGDEALKITEGVGVGLSREEFPLTSNYLLYARASVDFTKRLSGADGLILTIGVFVESQVGGPIRDWVPCPPVRESLQFQGGIIFGLSRGPTSVPTTRPTPVPTIALPTSLMPNHQPIMMTVHPTTRPSVPLITSTSSPTGKLSKQPTSNPTAAAKQTTPPQATSSSSPKPLTNQTSLPTVTPTPPSSLAPINMNQPSSKPTYPPTSGPPKCGVTVEILEKKYEGPCGNRKITITYKITNTGNVREKVTRLRTLPGAPDPLVRNPLFLVPNQSQKVEVVTENVKICGVENFKWEGRVDAVTVDLFAVKCHVGFDIEVVITPDCGIKVTTQVALYGPSCDDVFVRVTYILTNTGNAKELVYELNGYPGTPNLLPRPLAINVGAIKKLDQVISLKKRGLTACGLISFAFRGEAFAIIQQNGFTCADFFKVPVVMPNPLPRSR